MGVHGNATQLHSVEGIDYIPVVPEEVGGDDMSMHDPMDYVHESIRRLTYYISHFLSMKMYILCALYTFYTCRLNVLGTRHPMLLEGMHLELFPSVEM
jgi:hypothetical protein